MTHEKTRNRTTTTMATSVAGLLLLLPASYFLLTILLRAVGIEGAYHHLAPKVLDDLPSPLSLEKGSWIVYGPLFALILNLSADIRIHWNKNLMTSRIGFYLKNHWLNTAVFLQAALLSLLILIYLVIEHIRY